MAGDIGASLGGEGWTVPGDAGDVSNLTTHGSVGAMLGALGWTVASVTPPWAGQDPVISTPSAITVEEGATLISVLTADIPVAVWSLETSSDRDSAEVLTNSLVFGIVTDAGSPVDANTDNVYELVVRAQTLYGGTSTKAISVTVQAISTDPIVDPEQEFTVQEGATTGTVIGTIAATVDDGLTAQDFTVTGGTAQGLVEVNASTGQITVGSVEALGSELWDQPSFDTAYAAGSPTPASMGLSIIEANLTISGGQLISDGGAGNIADYSVALEVGETYESVIDIDSISTGYVRHAWDGLNADKVDETTAGVHTRRFVATRGRLYIRIDGNAVVNSYSCKKVTTAAPTFDPIANPQLNLFVTVSDGTLTSFPTEIDINVIPVPATAPTLVSAPTVSGTASDGQTLTAGGATWSDTPDAIERQWEHSAGGSAPDGNISGATGSTWAVDGTTYDGEYVRVLERAQKSGLWSDWAASAWVGPVNNPVGGVDLVNTSTTAIAMGEMTPPGARLPMIFEVQNAAPGAKIKNWTMASDPDGKFYAGSHGVFLRDWLDYSTKTSHTGIVQVTMDDDTIGTFSFSLSVVQFTGTTYYVDHSTGNDGNAGTSTGAPFKTLSKARSVATAGDRVYVKAGAYGNQSLTSGAAGTFADPIVYVGYQTTPGDNPAYGTWDEAGNDTPNTSLMPHIDRGTRENDNTGIQLSHAHNFACHFTISNYRTGANLAADWCGAHRLYTREHGRTTVRYSGYGVFCGSNPKYCGISHCYSVNANAQTITMGGDYGAILDSSAFCDNNDTYGFTEAGATDYYQIMSGNYGTIRNAFARRAANVTTHGGHGVQIKGAHHCFVDTVETVNTSAGSGFRHVAAAYGVMRNVTIDGDNGAVCRDGAHDNRLENWTVNNAYLGIRIMETHEDEAANPNNYSSKDNLFIYFKLNGCSFAIAFESYNQPDGHANGNIFDLFTITVASYLFRVGHFVDANNILRNSELIGVSNYQYLDSPRVAGDNQIQILSTTGVPA